MISLGAQIAAARMFLGWTQEDLARESGLSLTAVRYWEREHSRPIPPVSGTGYGCEKIEAAFFHHGVKFFDSPNPGVEIDPSRYRYWQKGVRRDRCLQQRRWKASIKVAKNSGRAAAQNDAKALEQLREFERRDASRIQRPEGAY